MGVWSTELKGSVELTNVNPIVEETFIVYVPIGDLLKAKREGRMVYLTRSRFEGEVSLGEKYLGVEYPRVTFELHYYDYEGTDRTVFSASLPPNKPAVVDVDVTKYFPGFGVQPMYFKFILRNPGKFPYTRVNYNVTYWVTWV